MEFLRLLDDEEIQMFRIESIEERLDCKFDNLNEILENLVRKEMLSRIEKGKYCKPNFRDEHVIGTFIAQNGAIAYWSALNLHGLTEQFANTVFVQTTLWRDAKTIFGTPYKFVQITENKRAGIITNGYGNYQYPITDVEKTIVDCFDIPQYSGGYAELIRAFDTAELNPVKLIEYTRKVNNIALIKRMGYLSELFGKKELSLFVEFAKSKVNTRYDLVDPLGTNKGEHVASWKLRLNISKEELMDIVQKQY